MEADICRSTICDALDEMHVVISKEACGELVVSVAEVAEFQLVRVDLVVDRPASTLLS